MREGIGEALIDRPAIDWEEFTRLKRWHTVFLMTGHSQLMISFVVECLTWTKEKSPRDIRRGEKKGQGCRLRKQSKNDGTVKHCDGFRNPYQLAMVFYWRGYTIYFLVAILFFFFFIQNIYGICAIDLERAVSEWCNCYVIRFTATIAQARRLPIVSSKFLCPPPPTSFFFLLNKNRRKKKKKNCFLAFLARIC